MLIKTILWMPILATVAGQPACIIGDFAGAARFNRDFHYSYPLTPKGRLQVETFNGSIDISTWDQPTVDISGTKYAPTQGEADAMQVTVDHAPDSVSVRVAHSTDWHGNRGAKFAIKIPRGSVLDRIVTSNGHIEADDGSGPARLKTSNGHIRVTRFQGTLDAETSNGRIDLDGVEGDATARTSNGHVQAEGVRGALQIETSNGGVNAEVTAGSRPVRIGSSNGPVELTLPGGFMGGAKVHTSNSSIKAYLAEPVNARLSAHTSNSTVTSEFDIRVHGEMGKRDIEGDIGNGGSTIDLTNSNGSIRVLRK
jgi:DUF4097 and DUF4098 domain-containing protein YvlB